MKLTIGGTPANLWGISLCSLFWNTTRQDIWDDIRFKAYAENNHHCYICEEKIYKQNSVSPKGDRDRICHEEWEYNNKKKIRKLMGFKAVCRLCSDFTHIGRIMNLVNRGEYPDDYLTILVNHFRKVNNISKQEAYDYLKGFKNGSDEEEIEIIFKHDLSLFPDFIKYGIELDNMKPKEYK